MDKPNKSLEIKPIKYAHFYTEQFPDEVSCKWNILISSVSDTETKVNIYLSDIKYMRVRYGIATEYIPVNLKTYSTGNFESDLLRVVQGL